MSDYIAVPSSPIVFHQVLSPILDSVNSSLYIWRLDQIDPIHSGNKWFKLSHHLAHIRAHKCREVISFGGAYSNHLHALAYYCHQLNLKLKVLVRGETPAVLSKTLQDIKAWGATIEFITRSDYRLKDTSGFLDVLQRRHPQAYIIPEGGGGELGVLGACDMGRYLFQSLSEQHINADDIVMACGTATMFKGVCSVAPSDVTLIAMPVIKGAHALEKDIDNHVKRLENTVDYRVDHTAHYGGYAKVSPALKGFASDMMINYDLPLDPIYTVKVIKRIFERVEQGLCSPNRTIIAIHSGGLQSARGIPHWPSN
jgi:1-aminocyclopropane-1-carboxylate deaminase